MFLKLMNEIMVEIVVSRPTGHRIPHERKKIAFLLLLHGGNNRSARVKRETPGPGRGRLYLARKLI